MDFKKIIDISMPLNERTPTYPGTTALKIVTSKSETTGSQLSEITIGSHAGTHIDAPLHCIPGAASVDAYALDAFVGPCRVIDCTSERESVSAELLKTKQIATGERILLKTTNSVRGVQTFHPDFVFLSSDGAHYLADLPARLVGIDSLSIKQRGSKDNTPHTHLLDKNIPILEGLDLSKVEEGDYTLIALPLAYTGTDGAPARAVLLQ